MSKADRSPAQKKADAAARERMKGKGFGGSSKGSDETVRSTRDGGGIRGPGKPLIAHVEAHAVIAYDQAAIGAIWEGFVSRARAAMRGGIDTSKLYPRPPSVEGESAAQAAHRNAQWVRLAQEREIGAQMFDVLTEVMAYWQISPEEILEWAQSKAPDEDAAEAPGAEANAGPF